MPASDSEPDSRSATLIRRAGLKVTAQRVAVFDAVRESPHSSVDEVLALVQPSVPGISAQAVYGILGAFATAGLVRRIISAGSAARFETRVGDNHHHLVCIGCGAIQDVDCVVGEAPCLEPSDSRGFSILSAEVTFRGLCRDCRPSSDSVARSPDPLPRHDQHHDPVTKGHP